MGRPLMEPLLWNATTGKPFGRSRLKRAVRALIDDYIRIVANATIALEFDTTPQKYLLGVTDEQYDVIMSDKFKQYVGSLLASTSNPETGENPVFGQLAQGSLQPHVDKMRMTATQFSAATGLTITDVGIINDANPTSSDAILAQSQTLVLMAQQLNTGNGDALKTIIQMAQAIVRDVRLDELTTEELDIMPHFKNPAMPSVAVTADAAIKIASARKEFSSLKIVRGSDGWKNYAIIGGQGEGVNRKIVTASLGAYTGDDLRELWVDAKDIGTTYQIAAPDGSGGYTYTEATYTDEEYAAALQARGLEKLAENLQTLEVDASIGQGLMEYGRDYALGDIVPLKLTRYGLRLSARISAVRTIYESTGKKVTAVLSDFNLTKEALSR